ncbi:hypothetical protein [Ramlibacter sp.]|uniref:hypothetical protein n=1 Tax=Ramlibacter sp. TaxID=1917967 RepID=UPI003D11F960
MTASEIIRRARAQVIASTGKFVADVDGNQKLLKVLYLGILRRFFSMRRIENDCDPRSGVPAFWVILCLSAERLDALH